MAFASLVMGILSLTCGMCCCCYGMPFNLRGIIFALIALAQIANDPRSQQGRGLAVAGLVLCVASFLLAVLAGMLGCALSTPDVLRKLERI